MKRTYKLSLALGLGLLVILFASGAALASGDPLVGTWHQRDVGTSNIFYFVDAPIGGVYHVLFYDDWTGVCDDNGPMLWAGFGVKDGNTLEGNFGRHWCPDIDDPQQGGIIPVPFEFSLTYDPDTDTISREDSDNFVWARASLMS